MNFNILLMLLFLATPLKSWSQPPNQDVPDQNILTQIFSNPQDLCKILFNMAKMSLSNLGGNNALPKINQSLEVPTKPSDINAQWLQKFFILLEQRDPGNNPENSSKSSFNISSIDLFPALNSKAQTLLKSMHALDDDKSMDLESFLNLYQQMRTFFSDEKNEKNFLDTNNSFFATPRDLSFSSIEFWQLAFYYPSYRLAFFLAQNNELEKLKLTHDNLDAKFNNYQYPKNLTMPQFTNNSQISNEDDLQKIKPICLMNFPLQIDLCTKIFTEALSIFQPFYLQHGSPGIYSMRHLYKNFFSDYNNFKIMVELSQIIDQRIQQALSTNNNILSKNENLFDDLKLATRNVLAKNNETPSEEKILSYTMNLLGLYSTGGANIINRLIAFRDNIPPLSNSDPTNPIDQEIFDYMILHFKKVVMGMSLLDTISVMNNKTNKLYSMPAPIQGSLDFARPYHFWLTAYFSFYLSHKFTNADSRMIAKISFLNDLGYLMLSNSAGRRPGIELSLKRFDDYNLRQMMAIVFAAAGANYGAKNLANNVNLVTAFHTELTQGKDLASRKSSDWLNPKSMTDLMEYYLIFNQIFIPHKIFDYFAK